MSKLSVVSVSALIPNDSHVSFNNKAFVIVLSNGVRLLQSYSTIVACINTSGKLVKLWDDWSATTGRHLSAFSADYRGKASWTKLPFDNRAYKKYVLPDYRVNKPYTANYGYGYAYW